MAPAPAPRHWQFSLSVLMAVVTMLSAVFMITSTVLHKHWLRLSNRNDGVWPFVLMPVLFALAIWPILLMRRADQLVGSSGGVLERSHWRAIRVVAVVWAVVALSVLAAFTAELWLPIGSAK